jgi:hypothetical protein
VTESVPSKIPAIISVILTSLVLLFFGILSILFELLAANGASESQGVTAMGISLVCQGAGTILIGIFAWWLTNLLITKFNWNKILAVSIAVFSGTLLGAGISFLSIIIAIPMAGIH